MKKLQVIGHRGVRNINIENTKSALKEAARYDVDGIEFDVRLTADKQLMLCHNRNLKKIYGVDKNVDEMSLAELKKLTAANGEPLPTLQEVLDLKINVPLLMDVKNRGSADLIYELMGQPKNRGAEWMITTFLPDEAARFRELDKGLFISLGTINHPFGIIKSARQVGANAVTINLLLLDWLNFRLMKSQGLHVLLYMNYAPWLLTTPWIVRAIRKLYPGIVIITDRPDKIVPVVKA